jgi:hypothetical protein
LSIPSASLKALTASVVVTVVAITGLAAVFGIISGLINYEDSKQSKTNQGKYKQKPLKNSYYFDEIYLILNLERVQ